METTTAWAPTSFLTHARNTRAAAMPQLVTTHKKMKLTKLFLYLRRHSLEGEKGMGNLAWRNKRIGLVRANRLDHLLLNMFLNLKTNIELYGQKGRNNFTSTGIFQRGETHTTKYCF